MAVQWRCNEVTETQLEVAHIGSIQLEVAHNKMVAYNKMVAIFDFGHARKFSCSRNI